MVSTDHELASTDGEETLGWRSSRRSGSIRHMFPEGFQTQRLLLRPMQAIRHVRAWRRRRARRIALGGIERVARGEIKELRRLLIRSGVSCEEVSQAMPVLLHCLVKRHREIAKSGRLGIGVFALVAFQMVYIYYFQISTTRLEYINDATLIIMSLIGAMIFKLSITRARHFERTLRYDPKLSQSMALKYSWVSLLLFGVCCIILFPTYSILRNTTWRDWLVVLVQVTVLLLYFWLL